MSAGARSFLLGVLGIGLFLALWETIGQLGLAGISWPPLSAVLNMLADEISGARARVSASPPWRTWCRRCAAVQIAWPRC